MGSTKSGWTKSGWLLAAAGLIAFLVSNDTGKTMGGAATEPQESPEILAIVPNLGPLTGDNLIEIRLANFSSPTRATIGGKEAAIVASSDDGSCLRCRVPRGDSPGSVAVTVASKGGLPVTFSAGYSYQTPPRISSVEPSCVNLGRSSAIILRGIDLDDVVSVAIGGSSARILAVTNGNTVISCMAPPLTMAGPADVVVTSWSRGTATLAGGLTYRAAPVATFAVAFDKDSKTEIEGPMGSSAPGVQGSTSTQCMGKTTTSKRSFWDIVAEKRNAVLERRYRRYGISGGSGDDYDWTGLSRPANALPR